MWDSVVLRKIVVKYGNPHEVLSVMAMSTISVETGKVRPNTVGVLVSCEESTWVQKTMPCEEIMTSILYFHNTVIEFLA